MQKNTVIISILFLVIGLVLGWLLFGMHTGNPTAMHRMPDGTMMSNNGSHMESMMDDMMSGLNGKTGDDFDKAFLSEMIVHHEGAVVMARAVLVQSKRPELIKLANDIIAAQTSEIDMMKKWQSEWFK